MAEHTKGQEPQQQRNDSSVRSGLDETIHQPTSTEKSSDNSLDEKSSVAGRREKNTGVATKDGLTGSDYDGQVTD